VEASRLWVCAAACALAALALGGAAGAQGSVTGGDIPPTWSPDGKKIAFARLVGGHLQLYVMNADGSGQRALTHGAPDHLDPAWSPDGKTIAFSRLVRAHGQTLAGQVYSVPSGGGGQKRLSSGTGGYDELFGWLPDEKQLLFDRIRGGVGALYVMNADGSGQQSLTPSPEDDDYLVAWSPNGKKISFDRTAANAFGDVYVMP